MAFRKRMSRRQSKRSFARKSIPHKKNRMDTYSMRGGYRL